jgi:hydroxymethylbilane synthase
MDKRSHWNAKPGALALWQAHWVKEACKTSVLSSLLVPINSTGGYQFVDPLYEMGVTGVFTKEPRPSSTQ